MTENILFATAIVNREIRNRAIIRYWLYFICLLVLATVVVGGATRLTDSGLSITEWQPILGFIPPLSEAAWQEAFGKYQLIPEFKTINSDMSLNEFKFIYWWEWAHRNLGRLIGVFYFVPLVYFWFTGRIEKKLKPRLIVLLILGGLQGAVGWWMVSSGLVDRVDVSQYRLAVHLTLACIIFAYAMWLARGLADHSNHHAPTVHALFGPLIVLAVLTQIFLGALVAGLDAGLVYNTWPLMDGAFIPGDLLILEPAWTNFFETPKTVQFNHRLAAYGIAILVVVHFVAINRSNAGATHKLRAAIVLLLVLAQMIAGIVTLLLQVPISWALVHQGGAVVLLGFAVAHWRAFVGPYPSETAIQVRS